MNTKFFKTILGLLTLLTIMGLTASLAFAASAASTPTIGSVQLKHKLNGERSHIEKLKNKLDAQPGINRSLRKKSYGKDVELLQQFLKIEGVYPEGLITGYFGSLTEAAVKKYQQKESIDPVGIAGPKTRGRILEVSRHKLQESQMASTTAQITSIVLSASIAENGSATAALTRFASTTDNIYAVLSLKNAQQDSQVAYIRYHQNNYVDSEVSHPSRDGLAYFHFQWSLKPGKSRAIGDYSLVLYINGKKSKTINYTVY